MLLYESYFCLRAPRLWKQCQLARRNQWLPPEKIAELRFQALRRLVEHSYRTVPFYRRLMKNSGIDPTVLRGMEDIERLPIVTRHDLMDGFPMHTVSRALPTRRIMKQNTGGSTGVPLTLYIDKSSMTAVEAGNLRFRSWYGWRHGDKEAALWGHPVDIAKSHRWISRISDFLFRKLLLSAFEMNASMLERYCKILARFRPVLIRGYTTPLVLLAETAVRSGYRIRPNAVVAEAETLFPSQRHMLSEAFGCEVFSFYGSREIYTIAQDCNEHAGLHVNAECRIVEVLRGSETASQGELGRVVITDLGNYATPLIRYENGDMARASNEACQCGRGLPVLGELLGRVTDLVVTPEGNIIAGEFFTLVFKDYFWVKEFYVEQSSLSELSMSLVTRGDVHPSQLEDLRRVLRQYLGPTIAIRIQLVNTIPRPASSKRIPVRSQVGAALLRGESFDEWSNNQI